MWKYDGSSFFFVNESLNREKNKEIIIVSCSTSQSLTKSIGTFWDLCWCSVLRSSSQASSVLNCGWSLCSTGSVASCSPSKLACTTRLSRGLFGKWRPVEKKDMMNQTQKDRLIYLSSSIKVNPHIEFSSETMSPSLLDINNEKIKHNATAEKVHNTDFRMIFTYCISQHHYCSYQIMCIIRSDLCWLC